MKQLSFLVLLFSFITLSSIATPRKYGVPANKSVYSLARELATKAPLQQATTANTTSYCAGWVQARFLDLSVAENDLPAVILLFRKNIVLLMQIIDDTLTDSQINDNSIFEDRTIEFIYLGGHVDFTPVWNSLLDAAKQMTLNDLRQSNKDYFGFFVLGSGGGCTN